MLYSRGSSSLLTSTKPRQGLGFSSPPLPPLRHHLAKPPNVRTLSRAAPDKSWSEILSSATDLAKDVVNKVKEAVTSVIAPSSTTPTKPSAPQSQSRAPLQQQQQPGLQLERPGFFGGLLGKAVGGLVASAVNQIGKQLEQAAQESQSVYDVAAARIKASAKLRSAIGEVQVGPIMSQSMASTYINGVSSKQVNLVFRVFGASGQVAQAQVVTQEPRPSQITVQLPNGSLVRIEDSAGGWGDSSGQTIDVEFKEVKEVRK